MEEGTSKAGNVAENTTENSNDGSEDPGKRFDEDALPVPLEEVELLTGGVDENDDRTVEFPWDEEARRARVAPRAIKFDGKRADTT